MKDMGFTFIRIFAKTIRVMLFVLVGLVFISFQLELMSSRSENSFNSIELQQDLDWKNEVRVMLSEQIISRGIKDTRVITAMTNTPRHKFVPLKYRESAYDDGPLPIGEGQTISQPYIVALMTELLQVKGDERVLEIGTGSGYQAAVLSPLVKHVYTIELIQSLADKSKVVLQQLGYTNITVKCGDGYQGWPEQAPFDRIIITAAPDEIPKELLKQLKTGGIMVVPVGSGYQDLMVVTKTSKGIIKQKTIAVRFVPMVKPTK